MNKWGDDVITNNNMREKLILSPLACKSTEASRLKLEEVPDEKNIRPAFFHDTDRIIHSQAYSRYIDKTQVFSLFKNDHITHRVLHVQLVSKIARTIGRFLHLNEDLIEAIALGHDIGHTPFGHDGEKYLDKICRQNNIGYFRHNAQSVRCFMELENQGQGFNLSLQVLDGILCHNGEFISDNYRPIRNKTWENFLEEYRLSFTEDNFGEKLKPCTMEGCVVRISDVIAYIGRDIEDAITLNLITREDLPEEITRILGNTNRDIVNHLITDLMNESYGKDYLAFSDLTLKALKELKAFNYKYIYLNPQGKIESSKMEYMFQSVFDEGLKKLLKEDQSGKIYQDFLCKMDVTYIEKNPAARIVIDFIAGMTDKYFLNCFKEMFLLPR